MDHLALREWFIAHKRDLPWRKNLTPYRVWISEVMLQQTQVAVVIAYFERWMERFPTIEALASSSLQEVLKVWEGLGYYSRARHLHAAAQYLVNHHQAQLKPHVLSEIKGIGPYLNGAIRSFAFHEKAPAIDGNVTRVLSRYYMMSEIVCTSAGKTQIQKLASAALPDHEPWVIMEALIELGAQVCQRNPKCGICPLQATCQGFQQGEADLLPRKTPRPQVTLLTRHVAVIIGDREVLLRKGVSGKVMADLYEFPYFDTPFDGHMLNLSLAFQAKLPLVKHSFTRFRAKLHPTLWHIQDKIPVPGYEWVAKTTLSKLPFAAGSRRILKLLEANEHFAH